jgi:hypothetical protein
MRASLIARVIAVNSGKPATRALDAGWLPVLTRTSPILPNPRRHAMYPPPGLLFVQLRRLILTTETLAPTQEQPCSRAAGLAYVQNVEFRPASCDRRSWRRRQSPRLVSVVSRITFAGFDGCIEAGGPASMGFSTGSIPAALPGDAEREAMKTARARRWRRARRGLAFSVCKAGLIACPGSALTP